MARAKSPPAEGELLSHSRERKGSDVALEIALSSWVGSFPKTVNLSWQCKHCPSSDVGGRHFAGEGSKGWNASGKSTAGWKS